MALLQDNINQVNSDFQNIKKAITETGVIVEDGTPTSELSVKVDEVYKAGKQAERENFWHNIWYKADGTVRTDFQFMFGNSWDADNFKPIYLEEIIRVTASNASGMFKFFNRNGTTKTEPIDLAEFCSHFDFSNTTTTREMFCDARVKNVTVDLSNSADCTSLFNNGNGGTVDNIHIKITEKCTNLLSAFVSANKLKTIIFTDDSVIAANIDLKWSPLTKESIISVINALSAEATGKTLTLKKTAVQAAFGTDYDSSTEWTTLKNSKSNWTIALS